MRDYVRNWEKNHNAVSVDYGPLTFSLKIGEKWTRYGSERELAGMGSVIRPPPWNYGLVWNDRNPAKSFELLKKPGPIGANPFEPDTVPIMLRARARKIPAWKMDALGLVGKLQESPVQSKESTETITLIPMGAARLRISSFPVIGGGPSAT